MKAPLPSVVLRAADFEQVAVQSNNNSQAINLLPFTPPEQFPPRSASPRMRPSTPLRAVAGDDAEIELGLKTSRFRSEQEEGGHHRGKRRRDPAVGESRRLFREVDVEQTGHRVRRGDGIDATSSAEASAESSCSSRLARTRTRKARPRVWKVTASPDFGTTGDRSQRLFVGVTIPTANQCSARRRCCCCRVRRR